MGDVFFGWSPGGRAVAVKLIRPVYASDAKFRRRFRREVEAGRKVGGFHAAPVVDADPDAPRPWMVTAYIDGPSLKQVLAEHRALPPDSVRVLGAGLAEALVAIHDAGLIHRDLKPSNILLTVDGPRVIDFGIAQAIDDSAQTTQPGTPGFMAPEVLRGEPAGWACDVFALGVVLAVASGIAPFGEGPPDAITHRIVHEKPGLSGLDPQIRGLVEQCLAKAPADRPKPERILDRLRRHGPVARWPPEGIPGGIPEHELPQPTDVDRPAQRLVEAERAARRVLDAYAKAGALVYVARVVSRFDPAHALRLLDDAARPTTQRDGTTLSRQQMLRHLAGHATFELGTVLARADAHSADRILDEIEDIVRSMIREEPGTVANIVIGLAEAMAGTDPAQADRIARISPDHGVHASAVARAAMIVARTDPARAEHMARTAAQLAEQVTRLPAEPARRTHLLRWPKPKEAPREIPTGAVPGHQDSMKLWATRALAEVAYAMTRVGPLQPGRSVTEAERTITIAGDSPASASTPIETMANLAGPAHAEGLLAEAEQLAKSVTADDIRALALTAVRIAAARIDPSHAESLLAEAEQFARMTSSSVRDEALGEVALAAARIEPARAEQIAPSLADSEHTIAEVASAVAATDRARAERIAASITDEYEHAVVMAEIAVRTDPAHAEPQLTDAVQAAHNDPARLVEVAAVAARISPARAEEIVRAIRSRDNIRTAEFWRARALAGIVSMSDEMSSARTEW
jgi:hypothetical protein